MQVQTNSFLPLLLVSKEPLNTLFLNTLCFRSLVRETIKKSNLLLLLFYLLNNSMQHSPS